MDRLPVLDYSFRWAEIVTGLRFEKIICWLCSPDCINLCQNLISCLEHFPFKSFRQELSNINLQVYLRRAHNAYFRTRYVARPFFRKNNPEFYLRSGIHEPLGSFGLENNRFSLAVVHLDARFRKAMPPKSWDGFRLCRTPPGLWSIDPCLRQCTFRRPTWEENFISVYKVL